MESISVKNLNFKYKGGNAFSLKNINFEINKGEFALLCGPSGCGKTTLLRLLKDELRPGGDLSGEINCSYDSMHIGYLFQNPESQIVCKTVEEELVFGAENIGMGAEEIRRSVAEITAYLGMEKMLHSDTQTLSGGLKQMLNLASILMMKPKILLLDEPVSQLDPVCKYDFVKLIERLKDELCITILMIEHNMGEFLPMADKVLYMENGLLEYQGGSDGMVNMLIKKDKPFRESLPETIKFYIEQSKNKNEPELSDIPYTVKDVVKQCEINPDKLYKKAFDGDCTDRNNEILQLKSAYFRYEKKSPDILKDLSLTLEKGKIYSLIGGNGSGKSTLFSVLSGYRKMYKGKLKANGSVGLLPQNPIYAFFEDVLENDYKMIASCEQIQKMIKSFGFCKEIENFLSKNPLDLSGGQMQKAAIGKMLLKEFDIFLMDEPVKGMDGMEKKKFGQLLSDLKLSGKTILFISHDLEFAQEYSDECLFMFDGRIIAKDIPENIFCNNRFYTTVKGRIKGMITNE